MIKRNLIPFAILLASAFVACQNNAAKVGTEKTDTSLLGNEKDSKGCLAAAGYSWSQLKDSCIRPWENSIALSVIDSAATFETAAYVIMDEATHRAEIFLKEENQSILLDSIAPLGYANAEYQLKQVDHCWSLIHARQKIYEEKK